MGFLSPLHPKSEICVNKGKKTRMKLQNQIAVYSPRPSGGRMGNLKMLQSQALLAMVGTEGGGWQKAVRMKNRLGKAKQSHPLSQTCCPLLLQAIE